ncbi:MAG: prolipoprotein diacylglyceryl transferase [Clostridia bacterium]|nr:prolipoprotein diacylglyceryl transferase [Clostridia bacterium]
MNQITFPEIGLKLNLNKIAFTIGDIDIYWYAIIIVTAITIAVLLCPKKDGQYGIKFDNILELLIFAIPISIITARLYYVVFNLDYYSKNVFEIFNIKNGGIAIYGALIGGALTVLIYCKIKKIDFLNLLDYIIPSVALAQSIGRWGNFINVEAYGKNTNLPWRMGILEEGIYKEVHPTFLYESICTLIIFIILSKKSKKRKFKGEILYLYIIMYSIVRFSIEGLRTDSLMLYNVKISQILSIVLFVIFCIILSKKNIKKRKFT